MTDLPFEEIVRANEIARGLAAPGIALDVPAPVPLPDDPRVVALTALANLLCELPERKILTREDYRQALLELRSASTQALVAIGWPSQ